MDFSTPTLIPNPILNPTLNPTLHAPPIPPVTFTIPGLFDWSEPHTISQLPIWTRVEFGFYILDVIVCVPLAAYAIFTLARVLLSRASASSPSSSLLRSKDGAEGMVGDPTGRMRPSRLGASAVLALTIATCLFRIITSALDITYIAKVLTQEQVQNSEVRGSASPAWPWEEWTKLVYADEFILLAAEFLLVAAVATAAIQLFPRPTGRVAGRLLTFLGGGLILLGLPLFLATWGAVQSRFPAGTISHFMREQEILSFTVAFLATSPAVALGVTFRAWELLVALFVVVMLLVKLVAAMRRNGTDAVGRHALVLFSGITVPFIILLVVMEFVFPTFGNIIRRTGADLPFNRVVDTSAAFSLIARRPGSWLMLGAAIWSMSRLARR